MRITDFELYAVPPRWLFLRVETSDGTVGWGEPIVQGRLRTVERAVEELMNSYLVGQDPLRIERHWQTMYRSGYFRGGPILMSAIAGIDQALWDIKGRHLDRAVHELLGGPVRDRLCVHQWIGGDTPADVAAEAGAAVDAGYRAIKMMGTAEFYPVETPGAVDAARERVAAAREAVGDDAHLGVDFHGRIARPMAKRLVRALEPYDPMFVDQPLLPEHSDALSEVAAATAVPLATGERFYSRWDFKPLLVDGAVSILQPDVSHVGGISELRRVASMAEAFDTYLILHCPLSPIAFAAGLQVAFGAPNVIMQEQSLGLHDPADSTGLAYLEDPDAFSFDDGFVERVDGPGLGIRVDEEYVAEQARYDVTWQNPVWRHRDGGVAEW